MAARPSLQVPAKDLGSGDGAGQFAASGANVAMVARSADTLAAGRDSVSRQLWAATVSVRVEALPCDVTDVAQIESTWAQHFTETFGDVDILVNNAGAHAIGPFLECSDERWQADLDLKLFAAIRLCRLAMPGMAERKWGRIINVLAGSAKGTRQLAVRPHPCLVLRVWPLTKVLAGEGRT